MARILLRGGCVLTLGARSQNLARGDVLLEDGTIAEIGPAIRSRDAEQIDATDTIVMPGFVDTHRHAWTTLFRNIGDADPRAATPASMWGVADHYGADDVYAATLAAMLGAAEAGITAVVDWFELPVTDGIAEAALQAHTDSGLRTVLAHTRGSGSRSVPLPEVIDRLRGAAGPRTAIALGSVLTTDDMDAIAEDWAAARELGLRIHAHARDDRVDRAVISGAGARGLLGDDVTLVHATGIDAGDLEAIAESNVAISLAPSSEMATGLGSPPIQQLIDRDVRPGLAVDDERVSPGDLFAQMRAAISVQHAVVFDRKLAGKGSLPKLLTTRDAIRFATRDGARVAGLADVTGSLEVGKRADLIVLRTDRPNIYPINDPIGAVVWGMDTSNVDRVIVDGRTLLRDGALDVGRERIRGLATSARQRVGEAAGLAPAAGGGA